MTYLLDVSTLLALLWDLHIHNTRVTRWQIGVKLAICPLTELGFLRISTQPNFGVTFQQAKKMLQDWKAAQKPEFVPCDLDALDMQDPATGKQTTDFYLASLAQQHGMRLATLDEGIRHPSVFLIPVEEPV
jgi:predicted nucleic acid-binding protein